MITFDGLVAPSSQEDILKYGDGKMYLTWMIFQDMFYYILRSPRVQMFIVMYYRLLMWIYCEKVLHIV